MKTLKLSDGIAALRRAYPKIDSKTRFLYSGKLSRRARGNTVAIHIVAWSADRRVTLHRTIFRKPDMTMDRWSRWLHEHAPRVVDNQVRAYMNRTFGSSWSVDRIFGWHFLEE